MRIPVTYSRPGTSSVNGFIVGASPVQLGVLFMEVAPGKNIAVDSDYIAERVVNYADEWIDAYREAWNADRPMALVNFENGCRTFVNC